MNAPARMWAQLMRPAWRWHRLAWFVHGCLERELWLNVEACLRSWAGDADPRAAARVEHQHDRGGGAKQQARSKVYSSDRW